MYVYMDDAMEEEGSSEQEENIVNQVYRVTEYDQYTCVGEFINVCIFIYLYVCMYVWMML
jgi:hypothetical protein